MRLLIAGAGIGGLSAAVALRQAGFDVHVYEQASVLREVGAGLTIGPNAVKILRRLGLAEALEAAGVAAQTRDLRDWHSGDLLARVPLAEAAEARWGAPCYFVHRADLHEALRAAVGDEHITLGARCASITQQGSVVTITFADGQQATGDLLIGADGIHSVVRRYVAGPDTPTWTHQVAWRGLAPAAVGQEVGLERRQHLFFGPHRLFVTYYVSGGRLINWVAGTESDEDWREESWSARGDRDEVLALYAGWHPQVRALMAGTEQVYRWALFDRPPLDTWTRGRVALLGDAAHPMLPYMGQGASQSLEDALVLARCLSADGDNPERALETYAVRRHQRAGALQTASRGAARNMQLSDPDAVAARNGRMRDDPDAQIAAFDWIWGYEVERAISHQEPAAGGKPSPERKP